jgi:hypothetical protein
MMTQAATRKSRVCLEELSLCQVGRSWDLPNGCFKSSSINETLSSSFDADMGHSSDSIELFCRDQPGIPEAMRCGDTPTPAGLAQMINGVV